MCGSLSVNCSFTLSKSVMNIRCVSIMADTVGSVLPIFALLVGCGQVFQ